ncbi:hypothetical protein BDY21DRAFT_59339 [Lineolata rhizophorae]|uniref:Uncharacterized protein n=1 Tax=Lineolata rhizophorae TaxID=578093 RepID=A0A6A6NXR5_9PEZI|nr:hypothetical protein BDY21DRAFT_59339 [Lineolata rhizophorae]
MSASGPSTARIMILTRRGVCSSGQRLRCVTLLLLDGFASVWAVCLARSTQHIDWTARPLEHFARPSYAGTRLWSDVRRTCAASKNSAETLVFKN